VWTPVVAGVVLWTARYSLVDTLRGKGGIPVWLLRWGGGGRRAVRGIILITTHNGDVIPLSYKRFAEMTNTLIMTERTCDVAACRVYQEFFFRLI